MTDPWLLIDFSYLTHRAFYSMQGLTHEDVGTGVVFGFFEQLLTLCMEPRLQSNKVLICLDSRQSYRRRAFPAYKSNRVVKEPTPEEMAMTREYFKQVDLLKDEVLPDIGFALHKQIGLESDDLMAMAAKQIFAQEWEHPRSENRTCLSVIVTADADLYQCINTYTHWYDPARRRYYDETRFREDKGVFPITWRHVKALAGCKSDNVPGVPGVGEKTAIRFLLDDLPKHHKSYQALASKKGKVIRRHNESLVFLPHAKTKKLDLKIPVYSPRKFRLWCRQLGLQSYLSGKRRRDWEAFFAGKHTHKTRKRKRHVQG